MDDGGLRTWLGDEAHAALSRWAQQKQLTHRLDRPFHNGRSGAKVGVVDEHDVLRRSTRKLVLKLDEKPDEELRDSEYARGRRAAVEAADFAREHLAEPVGDPIATGGRGWITFHRIAGGSLGYFDTAADLLAGMLTGADDRVGAARFAKVLRAVVRGVLADWAGASEVEYLTVPVFLTRQLGSRVGPGMPLDVLARSMPERYLPAPSGADRLVNPFALLRDASLSAGMEVSAPVGRAHGDLHVDNVLVRVRPQVAPRDYRLVDLARYEAAAILSRDPAHLVLHLAVRALEHLTEAGRDSLLEVLLDPACRDAEQLPGWLARAVAAADEAGDEWITPSGFLPAWREQRLLSLVAAALTIRVRASTRVEDHTWLLRLAARAATAFLAGRGKVSLLPSADRVSILARPVAAELTAAPSSPVGTAFSRNEGGALLAIDFAEPVPEDGESAERMREFRRDAVRGALERGGISWNTCSVTEIGPGLFVMASPATSPADFLSAIVHELPALLRELTGAGSRHLPVIAAMHVGTSEPGAAGGWDADRLRELAGLLAAAPLRKALRDEAADVPLALLVSNRCYDDAVRNGLTAMLPEAVVPREVAVAGLLEPAWLLVPPARSPAGLPTGSPAASPAASPPTVPASVPVPGSAPAPENRDPAKESDGRPGAGPATGAGPTVVVTHGGSVGKIANIGVVHGDVVL